MQNQQKKTQDKRWHTINSTMHTWTRHWIS